MDKAPKIKNDRTWCFWEKEIGFFDEIVYRKWNNISFLSDDFSSRMDIAPYQYKMIRGIDFYNFCFEKIKKSRHVEVVYGTFNSCVYEKESLLLTIDNREYRLADRDTQVFNSIYKPAQTDKKTIQLLQHFKGWVIETRNPVFDIHNATMMDFRVSQQHGTSFIYVLPLTASSALIEYTLFTKSLLADEAYEAELKKYIASFLGIGDYVIKEKEFGIIPMTNERFCFSGKEGWNIGTAGGQTKASSGYTFQFIQKQSSQITDFLLEGKPLGLLPVTPKRFRFYDNILLHILYYNKLPGKKIFTQLFQRNKPRQVLKFLDNESSLKEEIKIISSLPTWPFLKAALKQY